MPEFQHEDLIVSLTVHHFDISIRLYSLREIVQLVSSLFGKIVLETLWAVTDRNMIQMTYKELKS